MSDLEGRVAAIEVRNERLLLLLHQAVNALSELRERVDTLEGQLRAHTLITTTTLQLAHRSDPEGYQTILGLLERTEGDLERAQEDQATLRELREILGILRAAAQGLHLTKPLRPNTSDCSPSET